MDHPYQLTLEAPHRYRSEHAYPQHRVGEPAAGQQLPGMVLQLSVLAYNLGNLWRRLVLPTRIGPWSLTSLQQRLVKTGGRFGEACPLLLAAAGRESPDPTASFGPRVTIRRSVVGRPSISSPADRWYRCVKTRWSSDNVYVPPSPDPRCGFPSALITKKRTVQSRSVKKIPPGDGVFGAVFQQVPFGLPGAPDLHLVRRHR